MPVYPASQIIGKTMYAVKDVYIYRSPYDNAKPVFTVKAGGAIGSVYSFVSPTVGRGSYYFMFYDANRIPYYVAYDKNKLTLQGQGAKTAIEIKEAEATGYKTPLDVLNGGLREGIGNFFDNLTNLSDGVNILIWGAVGYLGLKGIKELKRKR
jgi:hypothetical protein